MLSVHQAVEHMLTTIKPITESNPISIAQAVDFVLSAPVQSAVDVPSYNNSAMDGFAFRGKDLATSKQLRCIGKSLAGHPFTGVVGAGECIRIMTGAQVPESVDTVAPQENTSEIEADLIQINSPTAVGANVRLLGEELQIGAVVYEAGHRLTPVDIGMLASLGIAEVAVYRPLKVAVFSTGDELVLPGENKQAFQLYDSNRFALHAMLERMGFDVLNLGLVADDPALIEATFRDAASKADAIVCSGGVSVGDADYTKAVIEKVGQVGFWQVAMKPGKPFAFGQIDNTWFFGLPGNPVSATVTLLQLATPALRKLSGEGYNAPLTIAAVAGEPLRKRPGRADFQRGILRFEDGENRVYSAGPQGSGMLSSMVQGNCLIRLSVEQGNVAIGDSVEVELLQNPIK
ncbi:gephyrin-like molybdotransferase Glp [Aliidiomarina quisquiliarum]|uniref:molybdopterin molybdotransferase MoeA n=1 Tax=Aliidiomarina quisquiliarum TaxID=2938947 RepID=UPI00208E7CC6|nr:gephyrin-like molybdotransferase Glp [Aliidiomarina quisquiliarum]MCO4322251.1 molybdopterin molybdotransferase MoeA [Aliidiomarina quisquiliarum]